MSQLSFTSWWIDNYIGWGQFKSPPTAPKPGSDKQLTTNEKKSA